MKYVLVIVACFSFGFLTACQTAGGGSTVSIDGSKEGGGSGGGGC
jgi:hypothetical protein